MSERLPITGYRGEPVPNRFLRQEGETDHLAVLLPGMGYTCDMPLFHYAENLLAEGGADLLRVVYAYGGRTDFRDLSDAEREQWLFADTAAGYRAGLSRRDYAQLTLVGKSLGTLAMGHLLAGEDGPAGGVRAVWLTPLVRQERLREQVRRFAGRSLSAIGTADPHYETDSLDAWRDATRGEVVVVEGADHGLDVPGDVVASVEAVGKVVRTLRGFLSSP